MRKVVTMLFCLFLAVTQLSAQNRTVTGKVTDEKGNPIPNASVIAKGTKLGTTTTTEGNFSLPGVPATVKTLTVSSLNFASKDVAIGANNVANASLVATTSETLDEVVVVGYGAAKKKAEVAGSLTVVSSKAIENRPAANVIDALQGKVAGLQVYTSSGEPSVTPSIRLNGVSSLSSSSTPLFVLDGIQTNVANITSMNPDDFESVTVLKDASSTSIYGAQAANGVILITTKKGKLNSSVISVSTQYAVNNLTNNATKLYNSFMNTKELTDFQLASGQYTSAQVAARVAAGYTADMTWYKFYYKDNTPTYQTDVSVSGGSGKTTYYISGSYFNSEGLAYRSGYYRYTLNSNVTTQVNNWFKVGMRFSLGYDERQTNGYATNSLNGGLSLLNPPYYSPYDATGTEYYNALIPGLGSYSPRTLADYQPAPQNNLQGNPSGFIEITPIKNLVLKTTGGFDFTDIRLTSTRIPSFVNSPGNGAATETFNRRVGKTLTNTAEYRFSLAARHNLNLLAGQEFVSNQTTQITGGSTGLTDDRLLLVSAGPTGFTATSTKTENSFLSFFGRVNYNFDTKYFLDLSIRNDQSSKFGRDVRGATFYSAGILWKLKRENFLSGVKFLNDLDLKASYGTVGNSAGLGDYTALATVGSNTYNSASGFGISAAGNPLLTWEKLRKLNLSLLGRAFNDKLNFELEYYDDQTNSMLVSVPYPYTTGFGSVTTNVGGLNNRGFSVTLGYDVVRSKNASLNVYTKFNYTQDKVTDLFQGKTNYAIPNTGIGWAVGKPVAFIYPIFSQINPATGLPEWFVPNADPNIAATTPTKDPKNVTSTFNSVNLQQYTGIRRYAPFTGSFGLSGTFRQFYYSADFTFASGKYMINNDQYFFENPNQFPGYNQTRNVLNYWKNPGDVTLYPKYGVQFTQFDSRLVQNASFMRLKNVTVGYKVPKGVLGKTKVFTSADIYITMRNIWTLTKYQGPDPEVDSNIGLGTNPNTSQVAFGMKFTF